MRFFRLFIVLVSVVMTVAACDSSTSASADSGVTTLQITDVKVGTGADAVVGRTLTIQYTSWLYSTSAADHHGGQLDSSRDPGRVPIQFVLGIGQVIRGWDQGIVGMRVGGQRTLVIPPSLAYGSQGNPPQIPSNATLVFDVELLDVR